MRALLDSLLLLAGTALDALGDGAVDVVLGDPARVKGLGAGGRDALAAGQGLRGLDDLGLPGGSLLLGLGEEGLDVGLVDKVGDSGEGGTEDKVQEDAGGFAVSHSSVWTV